jgi:hypothetical protein
MFGQAPLEPPEPFRPFSESFVAMNRFITIAMCVTYSGFASPSIGNPNCVMEKNAF